MRRRMLPVLAIALAMGLITSVTVYRTLRAKVGPPGEQTEEIVVAAANIDLGEAITAKHIKMVPWPKAALPADPIRAGKDAEGRVVRTSISAGEPLLESKLAPAGQGGLMPVLIPQGKRAVSIKVEEAVQKSGFVLPNSHVDVVVTVSQSGGEKRTRIVLQDITVLAADQSVEMKDNKPVRMTTVTMALTPEETERLALAQNEGRVTLALRNLQDNARVATPGVTIAQLMNNPGAPSEAGKKSTAPQHTKARHAPRAVHASAQEPAQITVAPPPPPPLPTHTVEVIRGTNVSEAVFVNDPDHGWLERPTKARQPSKAESGPVGR